MSVNSTNPSQYFGGTWVAWGAGRVPVGVDTSQTEFDTVEETGGEKTHTLTVDEMPNHGHGWEGVNPAASTSSSYATYPFRIYEDTAANWGGTTGCINNTGGGQAHNNLQPYITCYMWKRTA